MRVEVKGRGNCRVWNLDGGIGGRICRVLEGSLVASGEDSFGKEIGVDALKFRGWSCVRYMCLDFGSYFPVFIGRSFIVGVFWIDLIWYLLSIVFKANCCQIRVALP